MPKLEQQNAHYYIIRLGTGGLQKQASLFPNISTIIYTIRLDEPRYLIAEANTLIYNIFE